MKTVTRKRGRVVDVGSRSRRRDWVVVGAILAVVALGVGLLYRQHVKQQRELERHFEDRLRELDEDAERGMSEAQREERRRRLEEIGRERDERSARLNR